MFCIIDDEINNYGKYAYVLIPYDYYDLYAKNIIKVEIIKKDGNFYISSHKYPTIGQLGGVWLFATFEKAKSAQKEFLINEIEHSKNAIAKMEKALEQLEKEIAKE